MAHRLAALAEADLDAIWYYLATESFSVASADRLIDSLISKFLLLATYPYLGRSRQQHLGIDVRTFPVGEYVILYTLDGDDVLILRVLHGRRDLEALFASESM